MTTVATDGLVVATDTLINTGNYTLEMWPGQKLIERDGRVFTFSGNAYLFKPYIDWYLKGANPRYIPVGQSDDNTMIWAFDGGKLLEFGPSCLYPMELGAPTAMGTGRMYALGALALGHSPQEAVLAGIRCDPYSGGTPVSLVLPEHLRIAPAPAVVQLWDYKTPSKRALGGYARMAKLTPEQRSEFARKGGLTRQKNRKVINADHRDES